MTLAAILAALAVVLAVALVALLLRRERRRPEADAGMEQLAESLRAGQGEMETRLRADRDALTERLHAQELALTKALGTGLESATKRTLETMARLEGRLAAIDKAQENIVALSSQVVSLQDILANKQARGAFGEIQLADLVRQVLPPSAYRFQATLSNRCRADCLLTLPNPRASSPSTRSSPSRATTHCVKPGATMRARRRREASTRRSESISATSRSAT